MKTTDELKNHLTDSDLGEEGCAFIDAVELLETQLEATHRRCQAEIKRADEAEHLLENKTNAFKALVNTKRAVDGYKDKFYADYKAAAKERDLALLYSQLLVVKLEHTKYMLNQVFP